MLKNIDEEKLVAHCLKGHQDAWNMFVKQYTRLIYHTILKILENHNIQCIECEMEDLHSSIFLSFLENNFRKLRQYESRQGCKLSSWIRLITTSQTIDFLRKRKIELSVEKNADIENISSQAILNSYNSLESIVDKKEKQQLVNKAVGDLSPSDKLFLKLYYENALQPNQIASILNISVNTVYSRKSRICGKIKNGLNLVNN